jgi:hypothetical protein
MGDFNARVANENDYTNSEDVFYDLNDTDFDDDLCTLDTCMLGIVKQRVGSDTLENNFGNLLLDFCKGNMLYICNGRFGQDSSALTCKNASVVHYCIVSAHVLYDVLCFTILDFCNLLSNAHCPISLSRNDTPKFYSSVR